MQIVTKNVIVATIVIQSQVKYTPRLPAQKVSKLKFDLRYEKLWMGAGEYETTSETYLFTDYIIIFIINY